LFPFRLHNGGQFCKAGVQAGFFKRKDFFLYQGGLLDTLQALIDSL
jgi:hypothetical protein